MSEIMKCEERDDGDVRFEKQQSWPLDIHGMKDFYVEVAISYSSNDGNDCMGWYHGVIKKVLSANSNRLIKIWDEGFLGDKDLRVPGHIASWKLELRPYIQPIFNKQNSHASFRVTQPVCILIGS